MDSLRKGCVGLGCNVLVLLSSQGGGSVCIKGEQEDGGRQVERDGHKSTRLCREGAVRRRAERKLKRWVEGWGRNPRGSPAVQQ